MNEHFIVHNRYSIPQEVLAAEGQPSHSAQVIAWVKQKLEHAKRLAETDPQKLLERICQLSFAANALVQVKDRTYSACKTRHCLTMILAHMHHTVCTDHLDFEEAI